MRKYYILFWILIAACTPCFANTIDSIKKLSDVLAFIKKNFPKDAYEMSQDPSAYYLDRLDKKIADSLKIKVINDGYWLKSDLNNDGESDLILIGMGGYQVSVVIYDKHGYGKNPIHFSGNYDLSCATKLLPEVIVANGQNAIVLNHYCKASSKTSPYYYNFRRDTIILLCNRILFYQSHPGKYKIEQIVMDDNGACEGNCPAIHVVLDPKNMTGKYSVKYYSQTDKSYEGTFDKDLIKSVTKVADYVNLPGCYISSEENETRATDLTTATWKVIYDHGKEKTIVDYGHYGNATMSALYKMITDFLYSTVIKQ